MNTNRLIAEPFAESASKPDLFPGRVVSPRERGRPARTGAWRSQAGLLCLQSSGKGDDSSLPPRGRARRNGRSGAQSEAVAVDRTLFAAKRCGRDARAPGGITR